MEHTFEVTITDDPDEGTPSPTVDDVTTAIKEGLAEVGFDTVDVMVSPL